MEQYAALKVLCQTLNPDYNKSSLIIQLKSVNKITLNNQQPSYKSWILMTTSKICALWFLLKSCLFLESYFGYLGEVTKVDLQRIAAFLGFGIFEPHSHQALKLQWSRLKWIAILPGGNPFDIQAVYQMLPSYSLNSRLKRWSY